MFLLMSVVWVYVSIIPGRNLRKKVASTVIAHSRTKEAELEQLVICKSLPISQLAPIYSLPDEDFYEESDKLVSVPMFENR